MSSMIKTVYTVRWLEGTPRIDGCMSVKWPEHLSNQTINTLAEVRGETPAATMALLLEPEVLDFLQEYPAMELRARSNDNCDGPYVINSDAPKTDAELFEHYNSTKRNR